MKKKSVVRNEGNYGFIYLPLCRFMQTKLLHGGRTLLGIYRQAQLNEKEQSEEDTPMRRKLFVVNMKTVVNNLFTSIIYGDMRLKRMDASLRSDKEKCNLMVIFASNA